MKLQRPTEQVPSKFQEDVQAIAVELNFIKDRLGRLGIFLTMHAVDKVTGQLGYELAEKLTKQTNT